MESRVYAEDPYRNFLPSIGRLTRYRPPAETSADGVTVRNDTGVYEGGEISLYYDPMIAKLVTHAPTREEAIAAQADALDAFVDRRHPPQHSVPGGADGSIRAGARASSRPASSPRNIPTAFTRMRRRASGARRSRPLPPPSITCWANASAGSPAR